jgi:hypothetical protein
MLNLWIRNRRPVRRLAAATVCVAASWLPLAQPSVLAQGIAPPTLQATPPQSIASPPEQMAPPPNPAPPAQAAPAQPASKPGLFEAVGRWFDQGANNLRDHLRGAKRRMDTIGDDAAANSREMSEQAAKMGKGAVEAGKTAADATKNAVDAVAKLTASRVVQGRERCAIAPNGAPDCVAAAEALCRKNGYSLGKSMDFTSAEECPVRALLGQASRDECTIVTFISRAMCQ